jgi:general secretion pathway protein A
MYHAHFALREEPFGASPDHRFFLATEQHREALATLLYGVKERRGFALLVGNAGLGKTSVLVKLMQLLEGKAETVYLPHPYFDRRTVVESILTALGVEHSPSIAENYRRLFSFLKKTREAGKTCVVVFDEAHELDGETLEAIRMLSNAEMPSEKLIQIVLSGQPRLADTLRRPEFEQLRQRFSVIARLEPLQKNEIGGYMAHRLKTAGAEALLFAPEAVETIANASGGVPRNVNTLSFNALTLAYALNHSQVGREEVEEAIRDLNLHNTALVRSTTDDELFSKTGSGAGILTAAFEAVRAHIGIVIAASLFLLLSLFAGMFVGEYR